MTSPEEIVRRGYDAAARRYAAGRGQVENERHLRLFTQSFPPPAAVLDVGCGSGRPVATYLVERGYAVTGIDIPPTQIELARRLVPDAIIKGRTRRGCCPPG